MKGVVLANDQVAVSFKSIAAPMPICQNMPAGVIYRVHNDGPGFLNISWLGQAVQLESGGTSDFGMPTSGGRLTIQLGSGTASGWFQLIGYAG
jgi:hypothetical protein